MLGKGRDAPSDAIPQNCPYTQPKANVRQRRRSDAARDGADGSVVTERTVHHDSHLSEGTVIDIVIVPSLGIAIQHRTVPCSRTDSSQQRGPRSGIIGYGSIGDGKTAIKPGNMLFRNAWFVKY